MLSTNTIARRDTRTAGPRWRFLIRPFGQLARLIIGIALLVSAAIGAILYVNGGGPGTNNPPDIEGTWDLSTLSGTAPGEGSLSGVLWQRVAFRDGKVRGETMVLTELGAPGQKLPFPDESVDKVVPNSDGGGVRILWSGTYEIGKEQVTLHIGKAIYFVRMTWRAGGEALEFNQDLVLTYAGAATYGRANSSHNSRPVPAASPTAAGPR